MLAGYLFFDRAFAHLHVPGTPIYVAESVLAIGIVLAAGSLEGRRLLRFSTPVRALIGFMAWGALLLVFSIFEHGIDAVQDAAIWYYGLFAIVIAALMASRTDALERLIPIYLGLLVGFVVIGWARLAMNTNTGGNLPDTLVPWTSHRPGNIAVHAAVGFAFVVLVAGPWLLERFDRTAALTMTATAGIALLLLYAAAGTQNRGGLVAGFMVVIGVPLVARNFGPVIAGLFVGLVVLFGVLYISDASINVGRANRDISVRQIIDNIVSVREGQDTGRIDFWSPVVDDILTQERFLNGLGFGENLGDRYEFRDLREFDVNPLRNVHNSQLNILARMGVVGAGFWLALWGVWYYHLFRARARLRMVDSPRRAAFLSWAMLGALALLVNSFFDGTLEGPQAATWLWSIFGLGAAVAMETNIREWQRRRAGVREVVREGGGSNRSDMSLRQLKRASRRARPR